MVLTVPLLRAARALRDNRDATLDVVWSGGANLLSVIVRTLSFIILGRRLGPAAYGVYLGIYGVVNPLGGLSFFGLKLAILQRGFRDGYSPTALIRSYAALTLIQAAVAVSAAVAIATVLLDVAPVTALAFAAAELLCVAITEVASSIRHVAVSYRAEARISVGLELIRAGTLFALFAAGALTVNSFGIGLFISTAVFAVYVVLRTRNRHGDDMPWQRPTKGDALLGAQLSTTIFSQALKTDGDKAALNAFGMQRAAGLYGAAYRIILFALVPAQSVERALVKRFLRPTSGPDDAHMRRAVRYTVPMLLVSLLFVALLLPGSFLLDRVLGAEFAEAEVAVRWLLPILPAIVLGQAPANGLAALDKVALRTGIVIGASVLSLVLYVTLIPPFGWRGAAVASIASEVVLSVGLWIAFVIWERRIGHGAAT